jgi:type II secretory pathway component PulF
MPQYQYKARDKDGALREGTMEARGREAVADQLVVQGFIPVLIEEQGRPFLSADFLEGFTRVKPQDLIIFSRQLATLMAAGVPFLQGLATMEKQSENPRLKAAISAIKADVEAGSTFSDAIAKHPAIFSKLYVSMIKAGEAAGIMDSILNRLAHLTEYDAETRARVKAAVRYPMIVVVSICVAFAFLMTFVVPKFAAIFAQTKTELPLPTRMLMGINYGVQHYWYIALAGIGLFAWAVIWYVSTPYGRRQWDGLKLRLPVFGILFRKVALSRFARIFGTMQRSGISMMLALDITADTVGNVVIAGVIGEMRQGISEGKGLTVNMEASGIFPPLVVQMLSVGEETGQIDAMLDKVSDYYDSDVEHLLRNLSGMLEPMLLLFVGGMVLFLALAIFMPMWNMMNMFQK